MKTYLTQSGRYLSTQAEAKDAGEPYEIVEVPTSKPELLVYLNSLQKLEGTEVEAQIVEAAPAGWLSEWAAERKAIGNELDLSLALEEALWKAPLDTCLRLGVIVLERLREVTMKGKFDD